MSTTSTPSPAQLAARMAALITRWSKNTDEMTAWLGGTADGGPNGDGKYPLTDALGVTQYVECPAAQAARVDTTVDSAGAHAASASASLADALVALTGAQVAHTQATNMAQLAAQARDLAQMYADTAGTHAANALAYRNATATHAANVAAAALQVAADAESAAEDRGAAEVARAAAEAAAAAAQTYDPSQFYLKTEADGRYRKLAEAVPWSALSGIPTTFTPATHTHSFDSLTGRPTTLAGYGITDSVALSGAQSVGGYKTFTYGAIRVQGWGGDNRGGVVYLGSEDRYMYKPALADRLEFRFTDSGNVYLDSNGTIWTSGNFNPNNKQNYRAPIDTAAYQIADWNAADQNGWYMAPAATNAPAGLGGNWAMCQVTRHNSDWIQQEAYQFTGAASTIRYRRHKNAGTWGAWTADQYFHAAGFTGVWPTNSDYGGVIHADGSYMIMAPSGGLFTYVGSRGDVIIRPNNNDASKQLTIRASDGAVIAQAGIQGNTLTTAGANGAYLRGNGGGLEVRGLFYSVDGIMQITANSMAWVRQPRIFVGGSDPAASGYAVDGDIWIP